MNCCGLKKPNDTWPQLVMQLQGFVIMANIARIELEKEKIPEFVRSRESTNMVSYFHELGYEFVTIDLEGYRSGSFDKRLNLPTT